MSAFFENIIVWRGPSGQLVYGVSDCHGGMDKIMDEVTSMRNEAQLDKVVSIFDKIAKKRKQEDFLAIIEDIIGYKGSHPAVLNAVDTYRKYAPYCELKFSPLRDLGARLASRGIPFVDAEYRFLRIEAIRRAEWNGAPENCPSENRSIAVSGHEIVQEYQEASSEIEHCTEPVLHDYCQDTLEMVRKQSAATLESVEQDRQDFVQYVNTHIPVEHMPYFEVGVCCFDMPLFDARVVHLIALNSAVKKIILFCGSAHIYQVGQALETLLHYKKVAHVGELQQYPYSKITFDPSQGNTLSRSYSCLARLDYLDLIGSDEPERCASGSYS